MIREEFFELYKDIFYKNSLQEFCTDDIISKMFMMSEHMLEVNANMNLTAITDTADIIAKHLADSVLAAKYIPHGAKVCDVGCGGGFPSLPLAIARPDLTILGIDSTEKRINYVNKSAKLLELPNLAAVSSRAEELSQSLEYREKFDICIARAVASLPVLSELCIPFVKLGGKFIAMKGKLSDEELTNAPELLGAEPIKAPNINRYELITAQGSEGRCIVIATKKSRTSPKYPRNYSQIKKKPL